MSAFTWNTKHSAVGGTSTDWNSGTMFLDWSSATDFPAPAVGPLLPGLIVLGFGFDLTTSAVAGNRTVQLSTVTATILGFSSQAASLTRRWEFGVGLALNTPLAGTCFREVLPRGLTLVPTDFLQIDVIGLQAGDVLGAFTLRGMLVGP